MGVPLHLCWMLHNLCNFRCSYCNEMNWGGSHRWLKLEHVRRFLDQLFSAYQRDLYHVSFTGGEPTLWPDFLKLCRHLKERRCEIGMTSNGSKPLLFWEEAKDHFNWVCLSYHPEFTKDEHFLAVVRLLSARTRLAVRLMMHRDRRYWDKSVAFGEKLKALTGVDSVYVEYVPLVEDFGINSRPVVYAPRQQEELGQHQPFAIADAAAAATAQKAASPDLWNYQTVYEDGSRELCRPNALVLSDLVNFKGWTCFAGVEMLFVDHKGDLFRGGCAAGGRIANIFDERIPFPSEPILCPKNYCPCGTDIQVKKFRPGSPGAR